MQNVYLRILLPTILFCLFVNSCFSQTKINVEQEWLINPNFKNDPAFRDELIKIDRTILKGYYESAKKAISRLEQHKLSNLQQAALNCYLGNIAYNESNYDKSIALCDEALRLIEKKYPNNRYRIKALNLKAKALGAFNQYPLAEKYLDSAIAIARKVDDKNGLAASYYYYGTFYSDKGNYERCKEYIERSISIRKRIKDEIGLAACYSFLGSSYAYMDNYLKGIDLIQQSIVIRERIKDKRGLANSYLTLYKIYSEIGEMEKAKASEYKSLSICEEIGDLQCVSGRYTNIGEIYQKEGKYKRALYYHFKALELSRKLKIDNRTALIQENIARVYFNTGALKKARKYLDSSAVIRKSIGDLVGLAAIDLVAAGIYIDEGDLGSAIASGNRALITGETLKLPHIIKEAHNILHQVYIIRGDSKMALKHFSKFVHLKDSIYNIDQTRELLRKELEFNFKRKQETERLEQKRKSDKAKQENRRQKRIILYSSIGLIGLTSLLGFSIWQYRMKNKSKKELELVNDILITNNRELLIKSEIIERQSEIIQLKNNEITDSILYAQRIQEALLPTEAEYKEFLPNSFVLFEPKDIISGDFYWITKIGDKIIYVTADCTGHGVPGGFMSILGVSVLNELIIENNILEPAEILHRIRENVINSLKQKGISGEQQDGMDMTICSFNKKTKVLKYATANHVMYLVRKEDETVKLMELEGDKQPVGIFGEELKEFRQFEIQTIKGDQIYTFTDGYADQFGGPKGKKLKYKQLKDLILQFHDQSMEAQKEYLHQAFREWKGDLEQVDDVCLIGVKV